MSVCYPKPVSVASGLVIGGVLLAVRLQDAGRARQAGQDVRQALAGARTAIEAGDLMLAGQRVAEARGHLGPERGRLADVAADVDRMRREVEARQADAARFSRFLEGAGDAQDVAGSSVSAGGQRVAEQALGLYGVLTDPDWLSRLEGSHLTAGQKRQVRETAYVTLVSLANSHVRLRPRPPESVGRSLDLLRRAQAFHPTTRAIYFVRAQCRRAQGDDVAAAEDEGRFRATPALSAWDHHLTGHAAYFDRGDVAEAIRAFQAALALQPDHYNSLSSLAMCLRKVNRRAEAIGYERACVALRPDHADGLNSLAWSLATCPDPLVRDPAQAVVLARKAVERQPGAMTWNTLGVALYGSGDWKAAVETLEKAEALEPDKFLAHDGFFLAMAHRRLGREDEARAWYDRALAWMEKRQPKDEELLRFRDEAAALLGIDPPRVETKPTAGRARPPQ